MKWTLIAVVAALAVAVLWRAWPERSNGHGAVETKAEGVAPKQLEAPARTAIATAPTAPPGPILTAAEKATRVARIRADYEAIRRGVADELAAANAANLAGPGPFAETQVFLRRLVLLQREERADLARVLDERELEDFELRESPAGQRVAQRLGATAATEAQRRAVFRLEQAFDERFGFVFDLAKEALAERARVRKEADEKIRAVLGEELFRAWVGEAGR